MAIKTYLVRPVDFTETEACRRYWVIDHVSISTAIWAVKEDLADSHFQDKAQAHLRARDLNAGLV